MKHPLLLLLLLHSVLLHAQFNIAWSITLGGSSYEDSGDGVKTPGGGFVIAGTATSDDFDVLGNHGSDDFWIVKLDTLGNVLWQRCYGGSHNDDLLSIINTSDGGFAMAGWAQSVDGQVVGNHGDKDAWVVKTDSIGNIQWTKCFGGSGWEDAADIKQTQDGGFIIAGRATSSDGDVVGLHGALDYFVVKMDSLGALQWTKCFGGSGWDMAYAVETTDDGGYLVCGQSNSEDGNVLMPKGNADMWLIKLNFEGKIEWQRSLGGPGYDRCNDMVKSRDGGYMIFGESDSNSGDVTGNHGGPGDFWAAKVNEEGELEWQRAMGGSKEEFGRFCTQTADGGYIFAGISDSKDGDVIGGDISPEAWIVKLSATGEWVFQQSFGGTNGQRAEFVAEMDNGALFVFGDSYASNGDVAGGINGKNDYWVFKLVPEASSTTSLPSTATLNLFPNPASGRIQLSVPGAETLLHVRLSDASGKVLHAQTINNGEMMDIESLPQGMYLLSASGEAPNGPVYVGKLWVKG